MIAEAREAVAQGVMGYVTLVTVYSGVFILLHLVARQVRGNPLLPKNPRPFRPVEPRDLVLVAFGVFFAQQACAWLVMAKQFQGTHWGLVGILLALNFGVFAYLFAVRRVTRPRGRARLRVGQGLLVAWAALPLIYGLFVLLGELRGVDEQQETITYMIKGRTGWEYLAVFTVLVAPLLEEIAFRGLLYPALRARIGPMAALVATSLLFGLVHVNVNVIFPLAVFGVFLGYLAEKTGSILPCVVAHSAFNALTVAQIIAK